jgi:hypothetical protein
MLVLGAKVQRKRPVRFRFPAVPRFCQENGLQLATLDPYALLGSHVETTPITEIISEMGK